MEGREGTTVRLSIERQEAPDIIGHRRLKRMVLECLVGSCILLYFPLFGPFLSPELPSCLAFHRQRFHVVRCGSNLRSSVAARV
jgi:hypothetical protein